ncbi:MAG: hypothetical protein EA379_00040 [Phycisphaerales bacterium]|nr:MAG: hypothetical protein EA379_00040 [Phycisphaerales bacterium]
MQHAHDNQVVHRDIKPNNVLVTREGRVKLLDFGIAKVMNPNLVTPHMETRHHRAPMTLEYACPEQFGHGLVTTRSDVYALGVLLYELLTGRLPFDVSRKVEREAERIICDTDPIPPSTALRRLESDHALAVKTGRRSSGSRRSHARIRAGLLRGDLDSIVLMALAKAPPDRYASADALSQDVRRFLTGDPVEARPVRRRALYVLAKHARRNKMLVGVAAVALLCVVTLSIVSTVKWREAAQNRAASDAARADLRAIAVTLVNDLHDAVNPLPGSIEARRTLLQTAGDALQRLADERPDDDNAALDLARLQERVAASLAGLRAGYAGGQGGASRARDLHRLALNIRTDVAQRRPDSLELVYNIGRSHRQLGDIEIVLGDRAAAAEHYRRAIALLAPHQNDPRIGRGASQELISGEDKLSDIALAANRLDDARTHAEAAQRLRLAILAQDDRDFVRRNVAVGYGKLGALSLEAGKIDEATEQLERAVALRRQLLRESPDNAGWTRDLAVSLYNAAEPHFESERFAEALASLLESVSLLDNLVEQDRAAMREQDARVLLTLGVVSARAAEASWLAGEREAATTLASRALRAAADAHAGDPENRLITDSFADALGAAAIGAAAQGQHPLAAERLRKALELSERPRESSTGASEADTDVASLQRRYVLLTRIDDLCEHAGASEIGDDCRARDAWRNERAVLADRLRSLGRLPARLEQRAAILRIVR